MFDHWEIIPDDPLQPGSKSDVIIKSLRLRKGMPMNIPGLETFLDEHKL